ncbi:unnamed protein product [Acanthoscelides obtectus]|uniref:Uncharacterized protein n=1 Tax=Acanthoscelides obtectus TaxID=200917 RepID=A0A9P0KFP8_ACAOB|nr:unnamed protein product [Acanthoscelides obtectus]CAK1667538.1 hypothetical protein AOBTE_LOCUS25900 [Acanthoscelides obtectus]
MMIFVADIPSEESTASVNLLTQLKWPADDSDIKCAQRCISALYYYVYCFLYIEPCMKTTSHLDEAVKLTCRLSTKLPHNSTNLSYVSLQRKLDLLNKQLTSCKPYFSASGLFDVDYAIFSYIFAGISSVVIVYVQLM